MNGLTLKLYVVALAIYAPASLASAQWSASADSTATTEVPPPPPLEMVSETPPVQEPGGKKPLEVSFTWSVGVGVPIFLDVPNDVVRPGAHLFFFGGADFGFFILGGTVGIQWNPIDLGKISNVDLAGRQPTTRIQLSIPEVRFQIPDLKVVLPYISGSFDMNFWNFAETAVACGYWYCSQYSVYRFTPGFTGKAGVGFEVKDSGVYIDVAFQYSLTGKGNFFEESRWWLAPVMGVLVRTR